MRQNGSLNQCAARTNNHVAVCIRVVHFNQPKLRRFKLVVRPATNLSLFPGQTGLAKLRRLFVDFSHHTFERLLQMRRVVNFKHQLPRRRRQNWTINREGKLTTQRRGDVVTQIEAVLRLQFFEVRAQLG